MAAKRFDFTPIPQPAAPARDLALTASPDGSLPLAAARLVPLDRLVADPEQPRKMFDPEALQDLAESLRTAGMRQPITAYYDDSLEHFVVVSGERRLLAARLAGLTQVPVLVEHRPASDSEKLVLQLAENLVREDLSVPDAARALARLKELRPADWLEVARQHGINRRRAYQYLEHLKDPAELREALERGTITEGQAGELRRVTPTRLAPLLTDVVANKLSVADTRRLIAADQEAKPARQNPSKDAVGGGTPLNTRSRPTLDDVTAGQVADTIAGSQDSAIAPELPTAGSLLRDEKARRERSRRLRARLERITAELRNMHIEEVSSELTALPEIIMQARAARESLDRFIELLERVRLDQTGAMEKPVV
ncbi:MAG: stage 0 sporulation protein [Chloroflexi bacterium]|nr:stage 0 sporulation protein [Chloroflexota bacterium]